VDCAAKQCVVSTKLVAKARKILEIIFAPPSFHNR